MAYDELHILINEAAKKEGISGASFTLEYPKNTDYGDFSTNIALVAAKDTNQDPKNLAERLKDALQETKPEYIEKIEIAGPGFINFFLKKEYYQDVLKTILDEGNVYGSNDSFHQKRVMIEYTDPNPFKEFHIGHLMPNVIGEALTRIFEKSGADVKRVNYQGDVGMHVAKAIWGIQSGEEDLGKAYAKGAKSFEENDTVKEEIKILNKKIYERSDEKINAMYDKGRAESLEAFEKMYKRLGTKFDNYFFESKSAEFGREVVEKNKSVFEESDGAIVYRGERDGLHTRVFINSDELPTYEAKELGLAKIKYDKFAYDVSLIVTGNEINEYFKVLFSAMKKIFPDLAEKTVHIGHGMLRLPGGKMSSRTGDVISAETLIDTVRKELSTLISETSRNLSDELQDKIAIAAIKYTILRQDIGHDIVFDFKSSLSFTGESGPYLQYTHARAKSVVKKGEDLEITINPEGEYKSSMGIERTLSRYGDAIKRAQKTLSPHHIAQYLHELAQEFNSLYGTEQIAEDTSEGRYKLSLAKAVSIVLSDGLFLLGIEAPDKM
tara:strand:- start:8178 stop:9833 length:1656 start_codon:yes stop_codon:yes gene_type:complete